MVDSGATSRMKRETEGLVNVRQHSGHVYVANGDKLQVRYIGDTCLPIRKVDNMYMLDYYGKYIRYGHVTFDEETFPANIREHNYRVETYHNEEEDDKDSMKTVGAHQKDDQRPADDDGDIEDDLHQDEIPDDRDVNHVREDPSQVGATGWKDTHNIVRNMNNMGRTRSKTKAREHHRIDDGFAIMGGDFAFTAASEIMNVSCRHEEDQAHVRAERGKAEDAEYQAHMRNGTWELTPLPKGEQCISSGWAETDKRDQNGVIVRRKARFIAKGYSQEFGYDYLHTYAPVASMTTIRLILALTCILDLELDNMMLKQLTFNQTLRKRYMLSSHLHMSNTDRVERS